jgi:hypothetical protein
MKRIVNGVTYNTDTSTVLAKCTYEADDCPEDAARQVRTTRRAGSLLPRFIERS